MAVQENLKTISFDEHIVEIFHKSISLAFLEHGDVLRSVGIFFDFRSELNDAAIHRGMWVGLENGAIGPVTSVDGIVGSSIQVQRLSGMIHRRLAEFQQQLQEHITEMLVKLRDTTNDQIEQQENNPTADTDHVTEETSAETSHG